MLPIADARNAVKPRDSLLPIQNAPAVGYFVIQSDDSGFGPKSSVGGFTELAKERRLSKSLDGQSGLLENMPSLLDMEKALFRLIWAGFIALTAAIVFGMIYTQDIYGSVLRFDHKTVTTCLTWIIFGVLLWGHHFRGWRGRLAARWVVIGFCMLMVAYIGVRLVVEVGA